MNASMEENPDLYLAREFVENTGCHLFLTGKAGTGKTTFLKNLKKNTSKRMIVTAPTGVAAINAGGVTLHSFFQLALGPHVPGMAVEGSSRNNIFKINRKKRQIIKNLDLLVIDEISMVRCDVLDAVDTVLRHHRQNSIPFGGVQLLMIGDLYQLPPVAKQDEWDLLNGYYNSVFFFSAHSLNDIDLLTIELKKIYRQSDERFIRLLNKVRENRVDDDVISELNLRYKNNDEDDEDSEKKDMITLTTHNRQAEKINSMRLDLIKGKEHRLEAEVSGDFPFQNFPTSETLILKKDAQVMFLKNDMSGDRLYYNGKIGRVMAISEDSIRIHCSDDIDDIHVEPADWENISYTVDEQSGKIMERVIGTFTQFPLKLAWAITIHKSQGLTFEKAEIDPGAAFAHGQVYVALSRCKSLSGMVLRSPLPEKGIATDPAIIQFMASARTTPPSQNRLDEEKRLYQQRFLIECFDFKAMSQKINHVSKLMNDHARSIRITGISDVKQWVIRFNHELYQVSEKFKLQLKSHFPQCGFPESDPYIHERVIKASAWFRETMDRVLMEPLNGLTVEADNRDLVNRIDLNLTQLKNDIGVKSAGIATCESGFSPKRYLGALARAQRKGAKISRDLLGNKGQKN